MISIVYILFRTSFFRKITKPTQLVTEYNNININNNNNNNINNNNNNNTTTMILKENSSKLAFSRNHFYA